MKIASTSRLYKTMYHNGSCVLLFEKKTLLNFEA